MMTAPATPTTTAPDRTALRRDLEATREAFRAVVGEVPDAKWRAKSGNPGWTCGQLAWHIAQGVQFSAGLVRSARAGKQTNPPAFLMPLAYKANEFIVRRNSRNATRDSVLADYDRELTELLKLLDDMPHADFARSATNFGQARTMEEMFRISIEHLAEHAPQVRAAL
jgi:hypothetical protein